MRLQFKTLRQPDRLSINDINFNKDYGDLYRNANGNDLLPKMVCEARSL